MRTRGWSSGSRVTAAFLGLLLAGPVAARPAPERAEPQRTELPAADPEQAELRERIRQSQQAIRATQAGLTPRIARHRAEQARARRRLADAASRREAARALGDYALAYRARLDAQLGGATAILSSLVRMQVDTRRLLRRAASAERAGEAGGEKEWNRFFEAQLHGVAAASRLLAERLDRQPEGAAAGDVLYESWDSRNARSSLTALIEAVGGDHAAALEHTLEELVDRVRTRFRVLRRERGELRRIVALLDRQQGAARRVASSQASRASASGRPRREHAFARCEPVSSIVWTCRTAFVAQR